VYVVDFANGFMRGMNDGEDFSDDDCRPTAFPWCCCAQLLIFSVCRLFAHRT
jgi:hypothetical protein